MTFQKYYQYYYHYCIIICIFHRNQRRKFGNFGLSVYYLVQLNAKLASIAKNLIWGLPYGENTEISSILVIPKSEAGRYFMTLIREHIVQLKCQKIFYDIWSFESTFVPIQSTHFPAFYPLYLWHFVALALKMRNLELEESGKLLLWSKPRLSS